MARNNMNFSASLRLDTKEFNKGVKSVQKSLNGLKNTFTKFAAGIGLSLGLNRLIGQLKDTAVQLDTAKNVLHNVSEGTKEYGDSITFLRKISNDYGQDLLTLINTFGQFRAAAASSNLTIDQQRDIFQSLTRAAGAFHMSADRTKDMMIAVQQMFSKGKIAAEELRRQLGNSLPGAFNLMAKAAGLAGLTANGTTAELEDMMRKGKILADDIMPTFAKVLDEVTANASFDSLQGSLNRFKNAWTNFVEKSDFGDFFKRFVDSGTKALDYLGKNFQAFTRILLASGTGILSASLWSRSSGYIKKWSSDVATAFDKNEKIIASSQKTLDKFQNTLMDDATKALYVQAVKTEKAAQILTNAAGTPGGATTLRQYINSKDFTEATKAAIAYNDALIRQTQIQKDLGLKTGLTKKEVRALKAENQKMLAILASNGTVAVQRTNAITKAFGVLKATIRGVGVAIKTALASIGIGIIIAFLTDVVMKLIQARQEAKKIANFTSDTVKEIDAMDNAETETIGKLRTATGILKTAARGSEVWNNALQVVNETLGRTKENAFDNKSNIDDIVTACDNWIARLKKVAKLYAATQKIGELEVRNTELEAANIALFNKHERDRDEQGNKVTEKDRKAIRKQIKINQDEINRNTKTIEVLTDKIEEEGLYDATSPKNKVKDRKEEEAEEFSKAVQKQKEAQRKLDNQFKAGAITEAEYKKKQNELVVSTYETITAFDNFEGQLAKLGEANWFGKIAEQFHNLRLEMLDSVEDIEAADEAMSEMASNMMDNWDKAQEHVYKYKTPEMPKKENRSTIFDYKKSQTDIIGEEIEITENKIKELTEKIEEAREGINHGVDDAVKDFAKLYAEFIKTGKELDTLKEKMIFAELEADVKEYQQQMFDGVASGIKNTATSMDRLVSSTKDLIETLDDPDISVWEQIMAIFNEMVQIFDTITGFIEMFNTLSKIGALLTGAEAALEKEKAKTKSDEAALTGTIAGEEAAALTTEIASVAANKARASSLLTAAGAAASMNAMELPYPENLAALASNIAAVAAGIGSIKALNTFANGGIVGGNSTIGDKNVVRANSGEMILTKGQQGTLFNMLNGKGGLGGGNVEFKIRGADLVGTLNNYNNKKRG